MTNLSTLAEREERWEESKGYLDRALTITETTFGPQHPLVGKILWTHAVMLRQMHRKREAKEAEKRAKGIFALWSADNALHHTVNIAAKV